MIQILRYHADGEHVCATSAARAEKTWRYDVARTFEPDDASDEAAATADRRGRAAFALSLPHRSRDSDGLKGDGYSYRISPELSQRSLRHQAREEADARRQREAAIEADTRQP